MGSVPALWLTPDDAETYKEMEKLRPVRAVFLTQRTSDRRFLSQLLANQRDGKADWGYFYLDSLPEWGHGQVPDGFPLQKALLDCTPDQMFISDRNRWAVRPPRQSPKNKKSEKKFIFSFDNCRPIHIKHHKWTRPIETRFVHIRVAH